MEPVARWSAINQFLRMKSQGMIADKWTNHNLLIRPQNIKAELKGVKRRIKSSSGQYLLNKAYPKVWAIFHVQNTEKHDSVDKFWKMTNNI